MPVEHQPEDVLTPLEAWEHLKLVGENRIATIPKP